MILKVDGSFTNFEDLENTVKKLVELEHRYGSSSLKIAANFILIDKESQKSIKYLKEIKEMIESIAKNST